MTLFERYYLLLLLHSAIGHIRNPELKLKSLNQFNNEIEWEIIDTKEKIKSDYKIQYPEK